jgi:glycine/D-amino acid oxidase-like deaminating enzyme
MADIDRAAKRVAVVGSGITGLSAAWLLHRCPPLANCCKAAFFDKFMLLWSRLGIR